MVLRAAGPGVVGELVVVDGLPHGVLGVQGQQVGVAAVLRVARHVVVVGQALLERLERPPDVLAGRLRAARHLPGLVDVVAEVQHEVQVVAVGDDPVGVEEAGVVLRAGHHREPQRYAVRRQGAEAARGLRSPPTRTRSRSGRRGPARPRRHGTRAAWSRLLGDLDRGDLVVAVADGEAERVGARAVGPEPDRAAGHLAAGHAVGEAVVAGTRLS